MNKEEVEDFLANSAKELEKAKRDSEEMKEKYASVLDPKSFWSDEMVQKRIDEFTITDFFQTKVYSGRHTSVQRLEDGTIQIHQNNYQLQASGDNHPGTILNLTPESFSFLFEVMQYTVRRFQLDTKSEVLKLTQGKKIVFTDTKSKSIV